MTWYFLLLGTDDLAGIRLITRSMIIRIGALGSDRLGEVCLYLCFGDGSQDQRREWNIYTRADFLPKMLVAI